MSIIENYKSIGVVAGSLMLPWAMIKQNFPDIHDMNVSVFINLEGVLRNLTLNNNWATILSNHKKKVVLDLESAILNMVSSYRSYFLKERCNPRIFLYYTSLEESDQEMSSYSKYYRTFYRNKYTQNPEYREIGNLFQETIIPETKLILSYIQNCYLIESKNFDGSLIPLIIASNNSDQNVIFSTDVFDTLYFFRENFKVIYIKRRYSNLRVINEVDGAVQSIVQGVNPFESAIFTSELYYRLLLSIKGSKIRNINSAKGFGYNKFLKALKEGVDNGIVLKDFESIDSVIELFPEKYREDIKKAFQCVDLETQYTLLTETDIDMINSQVIDKVDADSLNRLNNERFMEFPINLPGLM